ncbi:MAG TPA: DUF1259 domain-containing protein [Syntrophomonadaceae bacterium]|nr:DUF1259 domain-containing protein [Syntrophomonadaceae bacterium]
MTTCDTFAKILKGEKETDAPKGVCFVTRMRNDLPVKILGRRTRSKVVFYMSFSFEDVRSNGTALCFGEFVFRQTEVKPFLDALTRHGIKTTAVHNHWLQESPRLVYIHWEAIMAPLRFARISENALEAAGVKPPSSSS